MAGVIWAEPALQDLEIIADYIALDKPSAAERLVRKVFAAVEKLRDFPRMGSVPAEIPDLPYRQLVVRPCRIFYRAEADVVYVLHVMRAEQILREDVPTQRDPNA